MGTESCSSKKSTPGVRSIRYEADCPLTANRQDTEFSRRNDIQIPPSGPVNYEGAVHDGRTGDELVHAQSKVYGAQYLLPAPQALPLGRRYVFLLVLSSVLPIRPERSVAMHSSESSSFRMPHTSDRHAVSVVANTKATITTSN